MSAHSPVKDTGKTLANIPVICNLFTYFQACNLTLQFDL